MNFIFLGPPGAGKGTIAKLATQEIDILHISTGDIFRKAIKDRTEIGLKVKDIIDAGNLVPDDITVALVRERLTKIDKSYILDGFPRTITQAEELKKFAKIDYVVNFEISDENVIKRLSGRRVCRLCGYGHHIEYIPPKVENICDKCSGELYIRDDDQPQAIRNRLKVYYTQTQPLIKFYEDLKLLKNIDGSGSSETVLKDFLKLLK